MIKVGILIDSTSDINNISVVYKYISSVKGLSPIIVSEKKHEILITLLKADIPSLINEFISDVIDTYLYTHNITVIINMSQHKLTNSNLTVFYLSSASKNRFKLDDKEMEGDDFIRECLVNDSSIQAVVSNKDTYLFKNGKVKEMMAVPKGIASTKLKTKLFINVYYNWDSSENITKRLKTIYGPVGKFKNHTIELTAKEQHPDFNYVINHTSEHLSLNTIYMCGEPPGKPYFEQYYENSKKANITYYGSRQYHCNFIEWHLGLTHQDLMKSLDTTFCSDGQRPSTGISKKYDTVLSIIVSDKNTDPGHRLRLNFIRELDNRSQKKLLPFGIHIYGRCQSLGFHNYKGEFPVCQKDDGLLPYQYHFNAENFSINNYVTEKFTDSVMAECYTFYWGCPNLETIYDKRTFTRLSLEANDIDKDIEAVFLAMLEHRYKERLPYIRELKRDILMNRSLYTKLNSIIQLSDTCVYIVSNTNSDGRIQERVNVLKDSCFKFVQSIGMKNREYTSYLDMFRHMLSVGKDILILQNPNVNDKEVYDRLSNVCLDTYDIVFLGVNNILESNYWIRLDVLEEMYVYLHNCHVNKVFEQISYNIGITFQGMIEGLLKKFKIRTIKM